MKNDSMIQRVKEALVDTGTDVATFDDEVVEELAMAAISAMWEPTRKMLAAGMNANSGPRSSSHGYIYRAMIRAALEESP